METITSHTCLWLVRKNLTSIMKVLLLVFVGFSGFGWFKSCFGAVFFDVFWLEITDEKRQTCHFYRNLR